MKIPSTKPADWLNASIINVYAPKYQGDYSSGEEIVRYAVVPGLFDRVMSGSRLKNISPDKILQRMGGSDVFAMSGLELETYTMILDEKDRERFQIIERIKEATNYRWRRYVFVVTLDERFALLGETMLKHPQLALKMAAKFLVENEQTTAVAAAVSTMSRSGNKETTLKDWGVVAGSELMERTRWNMHEGDRDMVDAIAQVGVE